ncbi:MAG: hypothetical protein IT340_00510 [Chloroflexi bacterium]|nr:hypothetical protein [Chloroflexota bacterium]
MQRAGCAAVAALLLMSMHLGLGGASPASADDAVATLVGRAVRDANRSGAAEPDEAGIAGLVAFIDRDGDGQLGEREPRARTDAGGVFRLQTFVAGPARVCLAGAPPWTRTTPRCRQVDPQAGAEARPANFGFDTFGNRCPGGGVIDTIVGVGSAGGPVHAPERLAGPVKGPWAGSRLAIDARGRAPVVYGRLGERFYHLLVVAPHPAMSRPVVRLTLTPGRERVVRVMLADGTPATYLGRGRRLPSPRPVAFSYFDQRGEIVIFGPPRLAGSEDYQDIIVVTDVRTSARAFTLAARLDSSVRVDGRTLPTCRDSSAGRGIAARR